MKKKTWIDEIVGKNSIKNAVRDSDKDGVPNITDCKPYDKNKQGVIHNIGARALEKLGATEKAEALRDKGQALDVKKAEWKQDRERRKEELTDLRIAERHESKKRAIVSKEMASRAAKEKFERSGGYGGAISRGFSSFASQPKRATPQPKRKYTTKRKKVKGKKVKNKTTTKSYSTAAPKVPKVASFLDYKF